MKVLLLFLILSGDERVVVGREAGTHKECETKRQEVLGYAKEYGIQVLGSWCLAVSGG